VTDPFLTTVHAIELLMVDGKDRTHEEIQQTIGVNNPEVDDAIAYLTEHQRLIAHQEQGTGYYRWSTAVEEPRQ
jgi:transcription initiation factor IIE alpha subunit